MKSLRTTLAPLIETATTPTLQLALTWGVIAGSFGRLFSGMEPSGDDLSIHLAEMSEMARALMAGDFQLWGRGANGGYPMAYYYQYLPMLPPVLLYILCGGLVSMLFMMKVCIVLPAAFLPITVFMALRLVGVEEKRAAGGGIFSAFVAGSSPWGIGPGCVFGMGLYTQPWALVFFPLALAYAYRYVREGVFPGRAAFFVLLTGLSHPLMGVSLAPALLIAPWWKSSAKSGVLRMAGLGLVVFLASAHLWAPILIHYDAFGGFPQRRSSEIGYHPSQFYDLFVAAKIFDYGRAFDFSPLRIPVISICILLALVQSIRLPQVRVLCLQGLFFALLVISGPTLGKTEDDLIPAIRFLGPMQLLLATAAGIAFVHLVAITIQFADRKRTKPVWTAIAYTTSTVVIGLFIWSLVGSAMATTRRFVNTIDQRRGYARHELTETINTISARGRGRLLGDRRLGTGNHWWMYLPWAYADIPAVQVYGAAALQASANFVYIRNQSVPFEAKVELFGTRFLIGRSSETYKDKAMSQYFPTAEFIYEGASYFAAEIKRPSYYFFPVSLTGTIPNTSRKARREAVFDWIKTNKYKAAEHLVIGEAEIPETTGNASIVNESDAPSQFDALVEVKDGPAAVALRAAAHPGWSATIDDKPTQVLRITPEFMAVVVPEGTHNITFRYHRALWSWLLMLFAPLIVIGFVLPQRRQLSVEETASDR